MENKPGRFATFSISDWAAERKYFGRFYISQGFKGDKGFTNDCGPASLAVILNIFLFRDNLGKSPLEKSTIISSSGFLFWDRLPQWLPRIGGATAPWGMILNGTPSVRATPAVRTFLKTCSWESRLLP